MLAIFWNLVHTTYSSSKNAYQAGRIRDTPNKGTVLAPVYASAGRYMRRTSSIVSSIFLRCHLAEARSHDVGRRSIAQISFVTATGPAGNSQ